MSKKKTTEQFIIEARQVHGNKYDYSKVEYIGNKELVTIICPIHGEVPQRPIDHLRGRGCVPLEHKKNERIRKIRPYVRQVYGTC